MICQPVCLIVLWVNDRCKNWKDHRLNFGFNDGRMITVGPDCRRVFLASASSLVISSSRILGHDDVIKWKYFPRYWPFARGIHRSPVNCHHKGQWCGALMFSVICTWINGKVKNRKAGDLRLDHAHYDVTVMECCCVDRSPSATYHLFDKIDIHISLNMECTALLERVYVFLSLSRYA